MPLVNVTDAFDGLTEAVQVETTGAGFREKGIWKDGASQIFDTIAVVQPASNEDVNSLNLEGDSSGSFKKFYSEYDFHISNQQDQTPSDIIRYKGGRFKVLTLTDWEEMGGYKRVMTEKLEQGY